MISKIELHNFLSYDNISLDFQDEVIEITGDNGAGKSALMEAIAWGFFGIQRYSTLDELIRTKQSEMRVVLFVADPRGSVKIERGRVKNKGFLKIYLNDVLEASGGADPTSNQAQKWINDFFGCDSLLFELTSFFGLDSSEVLLKADPSIKLETLQKLIGVDICKKIFQKVEFYKKELEIKKSSKEKALSIYSEMVVDKDNIKLLIESLTKELIYLEESEKSLEFKLSDLNKNKEVYDTLLIDLHKAELNLKTFEDQENLNNKKLSSEKQKETQEQKLLEKNKHDLKNLEEENVTLQNKAIEQDLEALIKERTRYQTRIEILRSGVKSQSTESLCPLCHQMVQSDQILKWTEEGKDLVQKIRNLDTQIIQVKDCLNKISDYIGKKNTLIQGIKAKEVSILRSEVIKDELTQNGNRLSLNIVACKEIVNKVQNEISLQPINDKNFIEIQNELKIIRENKGTCKEKLKSSYENLDKADEIDSKIKTINIELKELLEKIKEYSLIATAFSRYEIPFMMLQDIRKKLELRATSILNEFRPGKILISDTGKSKPGIDFILVDDSGERSYKGLSEGEKIIFYISIRTALTQLKLKNMQSKFDFLILDEITGHLSEDSRNALTLLIQKVLKKYFKQIFTISHTPLRDIFSRTLKVYKEFGISKIEIL